MVFWRSARLRCPICGRGKLFRHWFRMEERCGSCGAVFEREAGFFLGSIYFNYGLTALITAIAYPVLQFNRIGTGNKLMLGTVAFAILFPIWFFRYARSLWLGFDHFVDPRRQS